MLGKAAGRRALRIGPDRAALVDAIMRVGRLAVDHPEIAELDVNPLLVLPDGTGAWWGGWPVSS